MNPRVLRRLIKYMFIACLVVSTGTLIFMSFFDRPPGDYEVEKGDIHLRSREYDKALEYFDLALEKSPDHRGALMGRSIVFLQTAQYPEASAELTYLIDFLNKTLEPDDPTGRGALAAAYANRGILNDRQGRYEQALDDYVQALRVDAEAVAGPGLVDKILYDPRPSTVRKRARYIYEQLQLPESERGPMAIPERDSKERMYRP